MCSTACVRTNEWLTEAQHGHGAVNALIGWIGSGSTNDD